jgi:hypothetical protein
VAFCEFLGVELKLRERFFALVVVPRIAKQHSTDIPEYRADGSHSSSQMKVCM